MAVSVFEYVQSIETAVETCGFIRIRTGLISVRERSKKTEAVFLGVSRGLRGEIRNPPGPLFFCQRFLLGKQKKMLDGSRKSVEVSQPFAGLSAYANLALPLGELSPQATERALQSRSAYTLSGLASLGHLSQGERQELGSPSGRAAAAGG